MYDKVTTTSGEVSDWNLKLLCVRNRDWSTLSHFSQVSNLKKSGCVVIVLLASSF